MRESRESLQSFRPRIEQIEGTQLRYPHPFFGSLDLYQWVALIGAHEERHLKQIESLLDSPELKQTKDE
jgi:hypothetical protein